MTRRPSSPRPPASGEETVAYDLDRLCRAVGTCESIRCTWDRFRDHFRARGIWRCCYHYFGRPREATRTEAAFLLQWGWDEAAVSRYLEHGLERDDPFLDAARSRAGPVALSAVPLPDRAEEPVRRFMERVRGSVRGPGLVMACWGPGLRTGIVAMEREDGRADEALCETDQVALFAGASILHDRLSVLAARASPEPQRLTPREVEVMHWLVQGKTGNDIATILGLSRHTVDTLTRRIFDKLGVTGRTAAAIAALEAGLLPAAPRRDRGTVPGA